MGIKLEAMKDEDFNVNSNNWFEPGVYEVEIVGVARGKNSNDTEYIEFEVAGEDDQISTARKYITEKSAPYTRSFLAGLAVHNQTTEEAKNKVRDSFKKAGNTDDWDDAYLEKFLGFKAWIDVYEDENAPNPNGGFYKRTDIFHYEPKHREPSKQVQVSDILDQSAGVADDDIPFK